MIFEGWDLSDFPNFTKPIQIQAGLYRYGLVASPIMREEWIETYDAFTDRLIFDGARLIADFRRNVREPRHVCSQDFDGKEFFEKLPPRVLDFAVRLPDEIPQNSGRTLKEGALMQITVDKYERNPEARRICIQHYGYACQACDINLNEKYPSIGDQYIHVHHKTPLSAIGEEYEVDPKKDLIPVCPNCHAMIHRRSPPYTVEDIRSILRGGEPAPIDDCPF